MKNSWNGDIYLQIHPAPARMAWHRNTQLLKAKKKQVEEKQRGLDHHFRGPGYQILHDMDELRKTVINNRTAPVV